MTDIHEQREQTRTKKEPTRHAKIMRGVVTPIFGLLAVACIVFGILNQTIWQPNPQIAATAPVRNTQYLLVDQGVANLVDKNVRIEAASPSATANDGVCMALTSPKDAAGWLAGQPYERITGLSNWSTLSYAEQGAQGEANTSGADVAFKDSNMWKEVNCGAGKASLDLKDAAGTDVVLADFGQKEMLEFSVPSLINRTTNDITQIQMFITMGLQLIVKSPIMAVWAVCEIAGEGFEWTLATGIAVAILIISIAVLMVLVMPKFKAMQQLTDDINLVTRENLTGMRVVRAYNAQDYQEGKFERANSNLTNTQLFTNRAMSVMMPLMGTIMNGLSLAIYWIGAYLIQDAGLTDKLTLFSNMVVFSSYAMQVVMSFLLMSMVFVLWPRADVSAHRVLEVLDTDPLVKSGTAERPTARRRAATSPLMRRVT